MMRALVALALAPSQVAQGETRIICVINMGRGAWQVRQGARHAEFARAPRPPMLL